MSIVYLCCGLYALLFALVYYSSLKPALIKKSGSKSPLRSMIALLLGAFVLRIVIACSIIGHATDISCFKSWAMMAFGGGLQNFYSSEAFTDYPPGYMYVLWLIGAVRAIFNITYESMLYTVIIKLPAIICDLITGWFLYKLLYKRTNSTLALCLPLLYLINPAVIVNSAAWGQVDSVFTLFVVLFIYFICEKKLMKACIFYAIGFLIKPQTVIFTPILLLYLYQMLFIDGKDKAQRIKAVKEITISAATSIGLLFVLTIPFAMNFNFMPIIHQYISTLASYPYASVNAFNVFALFGGIWRDVNQPFLLLPYSVWSNIFIVAIVVVSAYVFIKQRGKTNLFLLGAFIITAMFTLAAKMHERYVFPAMILLLMSFAYKKDTRILGVFGLISIGQFLNAASMLHENIANNSTAPPAGALMPIVCIINIAAFVWLAYVFFCEKGDADAMQTVKASGKYKQPKDIHKEVRRFELMQSSVRTRLTHADAIIMIAVTLIYGVVALTNLGDMRAPVTKWDSLNIGDGFTAEFDDGTYVANMEWFTGSYEERNVDMHIVSADGTVLDVSQNLGAVFCWHEYAINSQIKSITLVTAKFDTSINEIAFKGADGALVNPRSVTPIGSDCNISALMDEQSIVPEQFSYKNSTYFDEIYHARTAYEYINGLTPYENTHPPLGKLIIALGILIFGMNPFGWRIMGTLFGVFMLPCIYLFAKKLFKSTPAAFAAIVLLATDFMHFAQTRIATIDVYITFFIILMYYFMYDYTTKSFYDTPLKKTFVPLAASGLCMGLGIASKWTGIYAGLGLAVLFFISLGRRIYEYRKVMSNSQASKAQKKSVAPCKKYCIYTILWCILFFVLVPALIYLLSYIPYLRAPGMEGFKSIIDNQASMFSYHSRLTDTHPFSSSWYQWPIISRPIWYYSGNTSGATRMSIASFGNPFVWWLGIGALVYCVYKMICDKSYTAMFLIVGYLAQYLPWVGVTRVVFIYHYFTCVPFVVLMLGYVINDAFAVSPYRGLTLKDNKTAITVCIYCIVCILAFAAFYPVLSGMEVNASYIDSLKWFQSWTF